MAEMQATVEEPSRGEKRQRPAEQTERNKRSKSEADAFADIDSLPSARWTGEGNDPERGAVADARAESLTHMLADKAGRGGRVEADEDDVPLARITKQRAKAAQRGAWKGGSTGAMTANPVVKDREATEASFELAAKRRVVVREWRKKPLVDVREFYDDDGVMKPGRKGLSLSVDQWQTLVGLFVPIAQAIRLVEDDAVQPESLAHVASRVTAAPGDDERAISFKLSHKRRVTVRFFRASVLVDLREFYEQGGVSKPGKKGIALSKDQWSTLQQVQAAASEAVKRL